jgi:hypothetical protein
MVDVTERVSEGFDVLAVVGDGGVPLNRSVKLIAKVDCTRLLIAVEEVRDGSIQGAGGLIVVGHSKGQDRIVDRGVKPVLDGVVSLRPHEIVGTRRNRRVEEGKEPKLSEHGLEEGAPAPKLSEHGLEEGAPAGEVRPVQLKGERYVRLDVDRAEGVDDGRSDDVCDERAGGGCASESRRGRRCAAGGRGGSSRVWQWKRRPLGLGSVEKKRALYHVENDRRSRLIMSRIYIPRVHTYRLHTKHRLCPTIHS